MSIDPILLHPKSGRAISESFEEFYKRERDGQVRRTYLMLGDAQAAHDVVADAFESVLSRWDRVSEPGPYLSVCVLNKCRDHAKRSVRETSMVLQTPDPGEVVEEDYMADCLLALPFRQRAAIVLRFYGGESEAQIAEYLECRPGTVGSLIHRGLASLRSQLTEEVMK